MGQGYHHGRLNGELPYVPLLSIFGPKLYGHPENGAINERERGYTLSIQLLEGL